MNLTKNFTLKELTKSETAIRHGIDNKPNEAIKSNLLDLAVNVLQPLRDHFNLPVIISSGYRSTNVNKLIGGAKASQHMKGQAADLVIPTVDLKDIFKYIINNLEFDQVIYEFDSWIHVSYDKYNNRKNALIATKENSKTVYTRYQGEL